MGFKNCRSGPLKRSIFKVCGASLPRISMLGYAVLGIIAGG